MCDKCVEASQEIGLGSALNPEPTDIQLATFARLVRSGAVPKTQPRWVTEHQRLTGQNIKPFEPDFRVVLPNPETPRRHAAVAVPRVSSDVSIAEYVKAFDEANLLKPCAYAGG